MFPDERGLYGVLSCTTPTTKRVCQIREEHTPSAEAALHDGIRVRKSSQNRKFENRHQVETESAGSSQRRGKSSTERNSSNKD